MESRNVLIVAILYSGIITYLFLMPTSGLPNVGISNIDKLVHVGIFVAFTFFWQLFFFMRGNKIRRSFILKLILLTLCYGIVIEVLQELFADSRTADAFDVLADMIGAVIGIVLFQTLKSKINLKK